MNYNPELYWEERGKNYVHTERIDELLFLESVVRLLPENASILDIGSGEGRVYSYLKKVNLLQSRNYTMCDFSDSFRIKCFINTGITPHKWDGVKLPYNDNQFDLAISFSVMLHVPADKIDCFIKEHQRVSKNMIFIATWYEDNLNYTPEGFCLHHDYYKLFEQNNLKILYDRSCYLEDGKNRRRNFVVQK